MSIILYTIDCPKCLILEKKLKAKNIKFLKVSDIDIIKAKGYGDSSFPILEVDEVVMNCNSMGKQSIGGNIIGNIT